MYHVKALNTFKGEITDVALEQIINTSGQEFVAMAIGTHQLILVFKDSEDSQ